VSAPRRRHPGGPRPGRPRTRAPHPSLAGWRGTAKRALDAGAAAVALAALSPVFAVVACAVALTSRGPVLYRQRRLGLGGVPFTIYKFRTMVADAEPGGRAVWAVEDDPRCTAVGGLLRRYGVDELPQLWNVLRGDMSLVGPRPERPEFAREFARRWPRYGERARVRCGLTGLAQVEGLRGDTPVGDRLALDLRYAAEWSLAGDAAILLRTVPSLLRRTQAERAGRAAYSAGGEQEA
jgi:lipopolysaccharide/colanic/teichoic acid biosynthesis glycosyltransferase